MKLFQGHCAIMQYISLTLSVWTGRRWRIGIKIDRAALYACAAVAHTSRTIL